jgi:hypothetical protein
VTDEEIVELGDYCMELREHPHFITLQKQFELQIISHFMSTEAHEQKKREGIYASLSGLRDFFSNMDAIVQAAQAIVAKSQPTPSEYDAPIIEQDEIDYL